MNRSALRRALTVLLASVLLLGAAHAEPVATPAPQRAVIRAVGDIMLHEEQLLAAKTKDGFDFGNTFELIESSLKSADYTIGNLEGTIGKANGKGYTGFPAFNAPPEWLDALKAAGFDMLTLANNHMLDRFENGVNKTLDQLDERQIPHVGANRTQAERDRATVVEVNGIKIGMLAYTEHTNGMERYVADQEALSYLVNQLYKSDVPADVQRLRDAGADLIVAFLHWGDEYVRKPNAAVQNHAKKLADMGVDVIIGSHPHVAQRIEIVQAEDGRQVPVAYSLGNFVAYMTDKYTDGGLIFEFTAEREADERIAVKDPRYVPVYLWRGALKNRGRVVRPVPAGKLWKEPLGKMGKKDRKAMKGAYRALVSLLKKKPAEAMDE